VNDISISDRITAPSTVAVPSAGLAWRPINIDDIDAITALQQAMDRVDHPTYAATREEVEEELTHSYVDLENDTLLGVDEDGVVAAYGVVVLPPGQETLVRSILQGGVHPDYRGDGIGRELLAWQESRALQQLSTSTKTLPAWIVTSAEEKTKDAAALFARAGFEKSRWFFALERKLSEPIPAVSADDGVTIATYSPRYSAATHVAKNDAFRDHWGSQPSTNEQWESMVKLESFHEEVSYVALSSTGDVVGFLLTFVVEDDWKLQGYSSGYIGLLGVVRDWRKKHIAPALLSRAFEGYREAGYERAQLDVDAENPSGALGLYQGVGFTEKTRSITFTKVF
jgi:mycothiol synthase